MLSHFGSNPLRPSFQQSRTFPINFLWARHGDRIPKIADESASSLANRALHVLIVANVNTLQVDTIDLLLPTAYRAIVAFESARSGTHRTIDLRVFSGIDLICKPTMHTRASPRQASTRLIMAADHRRQRQLP
jgi:hypothetical protein